MPHVLGLSNNSAIIDTRMMLGKKRLAVFYLRQIAEWQFTEQDSNETSV